MLLILDANLPAKLAEGLHILEADNNKRHTAITVAHADAKVGRGATDEEIIRYAATVGAIIVSQDDDFKRVKSNLALLKQLKVGYILYRPPKKGSRYWDIVLSFINNWEHLKEKIITTELPFIYQLDKKGISSITL